MRKGNFGIRLAFYGVLAFALAYLGYSTLLFLILGVALLAEKDEWTVRQVLQAVVLCFISSIVRNVFNVLGIIGDIPLLGNLWNVISGLFEAVVELIVLACAVSGIIKNVKDQDADIPGAKALADWAYGVVKAKAAPAPAALEEVKVAVEPQAEEPQAEEPQTEEVEEEEAPAEEPEA